MQHVLDEVDKLISELASLKPITPENQKKLDEKFRLEFNYNSNHLEGNTLTYSETELLLIFDETKGSHSLREYEEMKAHDVAFKLIEEWAIDNEQPLTEQKIKNLNEIILVRPFWKEAITPDGQPTRREIKVGNYKEYPNSVRLLTGKLFEYASPGETPILMGELIDWYRTEENALHPVTLAAMFHYKFVSIHPFDDGNGRIARLLMNYILMRKGLPPVVIKSADKKNYLRVLHLADVGDYEPLIKYIAEQLVWSLEISIRAAKGEDIEEVGDVQKEIALLNKRLSSKNRQTKHPAILYKTFIWFSKNVCLGINKSLAEFDSLFGEKREFHFVNYTPESFEKKSILADPFVKSTGPKKIKIFGKDIYEEDITQTEWRFILYGLKGAKKEPDLEIKAELTFGIEKYRIEIQLNRRSINFIVNDDYYYDDFMLQTDIDKLQLLMIKQILEEIKERVV